jgi:two-component system chemotaxis response regulator CheB
MAAEEWPIVVMGASAGGVEALIEVLSELPGDFDAAVFVVLHMPAHARSELSSILQRATALQVAPAEDNDAIVRGRVYVATPDRHLMIEPDRVRITRGPKECRARPAIDVLFRSAALAFGSRVIGVVLTGLLDDGTAGLWAIKDCGGVALVQDPATAMHPSMPQSARTHVAIDGVFELARLGRELARLATERTRQTGAVSTSASLDIENTIAMEGNGLQAGVMELGKVSKYTCPDCHGVLVQIEEGSIVRFRCHTGHAFSLKTLLVEVNNAIDTGLWATMRAVEERIMLLRQMAELASDEGDAAGAAQCRQQADDAEQRVQPLHALVLDPSLFGHTP